MIGLFDSGSGGLSVLRAIRKRIPEIDILYFGDIKNAPYGEKSQEVLSELTVHAIEFLRARSARHIVSACNSVSASLAVSLFDALDISSDQFIEMVGPTVNYFRAYGAGERVLLCATPATISSGIYQNGFRMIGKELTAVAIPELAGAIEFGAAKKELERIITHAFAAVSLASFDMLILGCTHYPLIASVFKQVLGNRIHFFNPAEAVAARVERHFYSHVVGTGKLNFVITKDSPVFRERVAKLFPKSALTIEVLQ